jgi:predicted nuclease with TOPRIM domain
MSAESQITLRKLKGHIEQIISKYELALSENESLKGELEKCRTELENKGDRIKELEKKVELMQLGDAFKASSEDVKEAKRKIGRIVREIDKCISMLND